MITAGFRLGKTDRGRFEFFCDDAQIGTPIWFKSWYPSELTVVTDLLPTGVFTIPGHDPNGDRDPEAVRLETSSLDPAHYSFFLVDAGSGQSVGGFPVALTSRSGGEKRLGFEIRKGENGEIGVAVAQPIARAQANESLKVICRPFGLLHVVTVGENGTDSRRRDCGHFFPGTFTYDHAEETTFRIIEKPNRRPFDDGVVRMMQSGGTDHGTLILIP